MTLYLLNSMVTPFVAEKGKLVVFAIQQINQEDYHSHLQELIKRKVKIVSAIGFNETVSFLKGVFPQEAEYFSYNRDPVFLEEGDMALVFRVADRSDKLQVWPLEEIKKKHEEGKTEFYLASRIFAPELVLNAHAILDGEV